MLFFYICKLGRDKGGFNKVIYMGLSKGRVIIYDELYKKRLENVGICVLIFFRERFWVGVEFNI